jgi:putative oxidoreductase
VNRVTASDGTTIAFDRLGHGRPVIVVGMLELAGAVGVLIPRLSGLAALGLVGLLAGATLTNVLVLGASPLLPIVLLVVSAVVAWGRWPRTKSLFTNREAWRLR